MSKEVTFPPENKADVRRDTVFLSDLINGEDKAGVGLATAPLYLAKREVEETGESEYVAVIDRPLGPSHIQTILESLSPFSGITIFSKPRKNPTLPQMVDLYEDTVLGKAPMPPGHDIPDMNLQKRVLASLLRKDRRSPEDIENHPVGFFYPIESIRQEFLETRVFEPSTLRDTFFNKKNPSIYKKLLQFVEVSPAFHYNTDDEKVINTQRYKNKIISKLLHHQTLDQLPVQDFYHSLTPDEQHSIIQNYALSTLHGYTEQREGKTIAVMSLGNEQQLSVTDPRPITVNTGNLSITGHLEFDEESSCYTLMADSAKLRHYTLPLLHWRTEEKGGVTKRSWDMNFLTPEKIHDLIDSPDLNAKHLQAHPTSLNPLMGITTLTYMNSNVITEWKKSITNRTLLQPQYIPTLAAIHQTDLFSTEQIDAIESHLT